MIKQLKLKIKIKAKTRRSVLLSVYGNGEKLKPLIIFKGGKNGKIFKDLCKERL